MAAGWELRTGRDDDVRAMYQLDLVCFEEAFRFDLRSMRRFVLRRGAIVMVAEAEGELAGFVVVHLEGRPERVGYVVTLDVAPAYRRQGLAKALLDAAERKALEDGAHGMALHVYAGNAAAMAFYERRGYAVGELQPGFYGAGLDGFTYEKVLGPPAAAM